MPEPLYARELAERTRKPLGSFVFGGAWGQPVALGQQLLGGDGADLVVQLVEAGRLRPHIALEAGWADVGEVAQRLLDRDFPGKAVLLID